MREKPPLAVGLRRGFADHGPRAKHAATIRDAHGVMDDLAPKRT
jgi:hypothetical protein